MKVGILSGGRCLLGFGRGAASVEYAGLRIPMEEARPRFVETAEIVVKALSQDVFEWNGEFFKIPPTSIRPRPSSHPERRIYASSVSPESAEIMAKLGFGVLGFGGMPHHEAELNMRLLADRVMPVPQRDPAFAWPGAPTPGAAPLPASAPTVSSPRPDRARHHLMEGHRERRLASRCRRLTRSRETTL